LVSEAYTEHLYRQEVRGEGTGVSSQGNQSS
jgi:hypothetical protein